VLGLVIHWTLGFRTKLETLTCDRPHNITA